MAKKKVWNRYTKVRTNSSRGKKYVQVVTKHPFTVIRSFGRETPENLCWAYHFQANFEALMECLEKGITDRMLLMTIYGPALGMKLLDEVRSQYVEG